MHKMTDRSLKLACRRLELIGKHMDGKLSLTEWPAYWFHMARGHLEFREEAKQIRKQQAAEERAEKERLKNDHIYALAKTGEFEREFRLGYGRVLVYLKRTKLEACPCGGYDITYVGDTDVAYEFNRRTYTYFVDLAEDVLTIRRKYGLPNDCVPMRIANPRGWGIDFVVDRIKEDMNGMLVKYDMWYDGYNMRKC